MSNPNVEPDVMSMLEEETGYASSQKRQKSDRVKIPKGHEWRVRFLPVEQGPRKTFWARYAFHWLNKTPMLCPRHTSPDFGGVGREAACALCNVSEKLNEDGDRQISYRGYKAMAVTQWLFYCLVLEKDDSERTLKMKEPQVWRPWEFWLTRPSFEDVSSIFKKGLEYSSHSFMDLATGNDFWVTNKKSGMRFQPSRPSELIAAADYDAITAEIWGQIKFPNNKVPSTRDLELAARKLEEQVLRGDPEDVGDSRGDNRGRGDDNKRRSREDDEYSGERRGNRRERESDDDPPSHSDDEPPARSRRDDREDDVDPRAHERSERGDREDRSEERTTRSRPAPPTAAPSPAPPARPSPPSAATRPSNPPQASAPAKPPAARSSVPPPPAARQAAGPSESTIEDEDNVPEEKKDPAPPAPTTDEVDEVPKVDAKGASPTPPRLSDRLRAGISAADRRG